MPLWGIKFKPASPGGEAAGRAQAAWRGPHPHRPADGLGPALESHLGPAGATES